MVMLLVVLAHVTGRDRLWNFALMVVCSHLTKYTIMVSFPVLAEKR